MIAPTSFFSDYGGHIRILEEMRALQDRGVEVAVVTYYKGNDVEGLDIRRTRPLPWRTDYEVGSSRHKLAFDVYLSINSLKQCLDYRPDIIHGHMHEGALIGGVLAKLFNVPLVFDFQGSLTDEMVDHHFLDPDGHVYSLAYRLERTITQRMPDAILTSTTRAADLLQSRFDVDPNQIVPLPDCADTEQFDPARFPVDRSLNPLATKLQLPNDRVIVGYLGLLTDYQGIPKLIEAAALLKSEGEPVHFLIMGYPDLERYQRLAEQVGVGAMMTFTGRIPFEEAPQYLSLCDIATAPKVSKSEGSGKLLNYMAMAQPIVAFDTEVNREYMADLGSYAPVGDVTALAARIGELARNPKMRAELGQRLRQRAIERYSWPVAAEQIENLYWALTNPAH